MTFDRAQFEAEMERLKQIPTLMNEEWESSRWVDEANKKKEKQQSGDHGNSATNIPD